MKRCDYCGVMTVADEEECQLCGACLMCGCRRQCAAELEQEVRDAEEDRHNDRLRQEQQEAERQP